MKIGDIVEFKAYGQTEVRRGSLESSSGMLFVAGENEHIYTIGVLDMIQICPGEYKEKRKKIYRVNALCPHCGEEHAYFDILISDEDQEKWIHIMLKIKTKRHYHCC